MKTKILAIALAAFFMLQAGCGQPADRPVVSPVPETVAHNAVVLPDSIHQQQERNMDRARLAGEEIQGDFNGDGKLETASAVQTKKGEGNPVEDGVPAAYAIRFSTADLSQLDAGCCDFRLINEGDLNNDGADDISIFQAPMNGCTYTMTTYSLQQGKWTPIIAPFLVPTGCDEVTDEVLQQRIFKEADTVFYLETDVNDEHFKTFRKVAFVNH